MKLPRNELISLQKSWYRMLAEAGFNDIETFRGDELILKESDAFGARTRFRNHDAFSVEFQTEYFRHLGHMVNDEATVFKNDIERHIMTRHAEGAKIKTITAELNKLGTPRNRQSVYFVIRKYELAWGIKE